METPVVLVVLYLLAAWTWGCLACVAEYWLPAAIHLQQRNRGVHAAAAVPGGTPGPVAGRRRGGGGGHRADGRVRHGELQAVAVVLPTYLLAGMGKLLRPHIVAAVLACLDRVGSGQRMPNGDGPDEALPLA